jgi:broad specificity phosphatase PhoE
MGHLTLVRHGQASFFGVDYDNLSEAGVRQGRTLGEHWARHGIRFDVAYVGPRRRHRQTLDAVVEGYGDRLPWAQVVDVPELDEHEGLKVMRHALTANGSIPGEPPAREPDEAERKRLLKMFHLQYLDVMRDWATGALVVPDVEGWPAFRARTLRGLDVMCQGDDRRVAFTSGGFVSSATGWLLGLDEDRVIELSAVVNNTSLTEVRHWGPRRTLVTFNTVPHIPDGQAITAI